MDAAAQELRAALRESQTQRDARVAARVAHLRGLVPGAAALLRRYGARRVWVFGSLVWGPVHDGSDLDLAVEGLTPGRFFEAYEALWALAGEPVDLVPVERAADTLRARILADAEEVAP